MIHRKIGPMSKAILLAIALAAAGAASAQSTDGTIAGVANEGDTIYLRGDNGVQREIHIDKTGKFTVRHLPVGTYDVLRADKAGNMTTQTAIVLVGKTARLQ